MIDQLGVNRDLMFFFVEEELKVYRFVVTEKLTIFDYVPTIGDDLRWREHCEWTQFGEGIPTTNCTATVLGEDLVAVCSKLGDRMFYVYISQGGVPKWVQVR